MNLSDALYSEYNKSGAASHSGNIFQSIVVASDPGSFCVQVTPMGQRNQGLLQGIPISSCMSHLLGFKEISLPQVGATVLCYRSATNQCIIFGVVPKPDRLGEEGFMPSRTIIGAGDGNNDEQNTQGYMGAGASKLHTINNSRPTDMVEGEYGIGNEFGVLMGLFSHFAVLKGSELAQIQTFVLDDLVRIISHNFQHFTCMGETKVFHDGKGLHLEVGMTHQPKEALGTVEVRIEKKPSVISHTGNASLDDTENFYELKDGVVGIERLKLLVGKLGDFVNLMLVKPAEDVTKPDTGLFNFHLLGDGTTIFRSTKGITIEKTNWIRVPNRVKAPENPMGDDGTTLEYPNKQAYNFDNSYTYEQQPFLYFLQIRDYMAYMNEEYGLANIKAHEKDFIVNDDPNLEERLTGIQKVDPLSDTHYEKRTASLNLMPNGGISLIDAWGSAIILEGGNIYVQAAKDEIHQPLRNLISKVGKNVSVQAKEDIDMSSTDGGFRLKTEKSQYFYSDKSGIVLHAEGEPTANFFPEDEAIQGIAGIVIKAPNTGIYTYADFSFNRTKRNAVIYADEIFIKADKNITNSAKDRVDVQADNTITIGANNIFAVADGEAIFTGIQGTIVGMRNQTFAMCPVGAVTGFLEEDSLKDIRDYNDKVAILESNKFVPNFQEDTAFDDLKFRFLSSSHYGPFDASDILPQTMAQIEDATFGLHNLVLWEEKAVNETYPFPGADKEFSLVTGTIKNLELGDNELRNKASGNETVGSLLTTISIFKDYTIKV